MYPIILSGGSGTRLWPLSRSLYPKQFLSLHSEKTLFQETVLRLDIIDTHAPIIVCNEEHRFIVAENMRALNQEPHAILLEPVGRNTAPAIAIAALMVVEDDKDAILLALPADHVIEDKQAFAKAVKFAENLAKEGRIVTFGIKPTHPHTGYGYIETGDEIIDNAYNISSFKEKPDHDTACSFVEDGNYLWNSGVYCFKAQTYLYELEKHHPELIKHAKASLENAQKDMDFIRLESKHFEKCIDISIDYAVMEHTKHGAMISLDAGWSDIGSWDALWDICSKDENNNALKGDVIVQNTKNSFIYGTDKLICTLGLENVVIVDTQDALFVANKDQVSDVKNIVADLKKNQRKEVNHHRTVYRPWGKYDLICFEERDQVKRISVNPGAKLSLQKHFHRSEHWVVVKGTALVTRGEDTLTVSENESVYLPAGMVHALENPGKTTLEIIEIQTGSYLGEDDIVRFEDRYGRT